MTQLIHFSRSDTRFCGANEQGRRITTDPEKVTCPECKSRDRFVLTEQGQKFVDGLKS